MLSAIELGKPEGRIVHENCNPKGYLRYHFAFCRRWKIRDLAIFGSILRDDFGPESDIDFLVEFEPDANWSLLDHTQMEQELSELLDREVHLISKRALEYTHNYLFRQEVLGTAKVVFSSEGS
ncbi:nucleotidyltransferase family protein, partial [Thermoflexus hugenholtzii]